MRREGFSDRVGEEDVSMEYKDRGLLNVSLQVGSACDSSGDLTKLPAILLLVFVLVTGVIGNGLVFTTSTIRPKRSSCSQFILHLAVYDIIACVTVIPVALVGLLHRNIVHHNIICKLFMFLCLLLALSSLVTLDLVAVDRFLKICRPFSYGISYESSKRLFFLEFITGLVFALATLFFQGVSRLRNQSAPVYCYRGICLLNNDFYASEYRFVFNLMIAIVLAAMFLVLIVCYALVMKVLLRRKAGHLRPVPRVTVTDTVPSDHQPLQTMSSSPQMLGQPCPDSPVGQPCPDSHVGQPCPDSPVGQPCPDSPQELSVSECYRTTTFVLGSTGDLQQTECTDTDRPESDLRTASQTLPLREDFLLKSSTTKTSAKPSHRRQISATKSAKILSIVTLGFVLCWLPTWALGTFIRLHVRSAEGLIQMAPAHDSAVMFFQFWYLTNHAVNPVIYAFMDHQFRQDCLNLLTQIRLLSPLAAQRRQPTQTAKTL